MMGKMGSVAALRDEAYGELIAEGYTPQEAMTAADRIAWRDWQARLAARRSGATEAPATVPVWGSRTRRPR